jgi:hypothetical protein
MSDTTSDTSLIDQIKEENSSTNNSGNVIVNILSFIRSLIALIIVVLLYFSSSSLILYVCKLAQTNILPTEQNCYPYTENKPNITKIKTNIFTTFTDPEMSMKLEFPYDDYNSDNIILNMFRDYKNKSSSNFLANYFISIIENLMNFNYSTINTIMNSLNGLPEFIIILFGPFIIGLLFSIMTFTNLIYIIYLWFVNMEWFFKSNTNVSGSGLPTWETVTLLSPFNWFLGLSLVILFLILFFIGIGLISFLPFIILFYCCFTCIMYKSLFNDKKSSSLTIIKEVLKNYKITIVSIISLFVVLLAFSNLGVIPGIFSILTVICIYWGVISINIFKPISQQNLTEVVSYDQAKKTCITKGETKNGSWFLRLFGNQKGGNITKELKKIAKNQDKSN